MKILFKLLHKQKVTRNHCLIAIGRGVLFNLDQIVYGKSYNDKIGAAVVSGIPSITDRFADGSVVYLQKRL